MSLSNLRKSISQARNSIDAFAMIGGTLLWDCSDILVETNIRAIKKRILFPSLNSLWLEAYLKELGVPLTEYEHKILHNSERANQFGFEVRYHGHPITAWYVIVDGKEVFQKQIGVLTPTYPEAVHLAEASVQFSLLFETIWKSSHIETKSPACDSNKAATKAALEHPDITSAYSLRVFMSHSSADKPAVRSVYHRLIKLGIIPWFDEVDLLPGQDFDYEIDRAVKQSDVIIIFLSNASTRKVGYLQKELRYALDVASRQPEGTIFLIPVLLEPCDVPRSLMHLHYVKLFEDSGLERLVAALKARLRKERMPNTHSTEPRC